MTPVGLPCQAGVRSRRLVRAHYVGGVEIGLGFGLSKQEIVGGDYRTSVDMTMEPPPVPRSSGGELCVLG